MTSGRVSRLAPPSGGRATRTLSTLEAGDLLATDGPGGVDAGLEAGADGVVFLFHSVRLALLGGRLGSRGLLVRRRHGGCEQAGREKKGREKQPQGKW